MKTLTLLLVIIFCILFQQLRAQQPAALIKKHVIHHKKFKHWIYSPNPYPSDDDCVFTNSFSLYQRLKLYPFYRAKKIVAVSFLGIEPRPDVLINDTLNVKDTIEKKIINTELSKNVSHTVFKSGLHIKNGKLNYSSIIEVKELNYEQIGKLTNIIYNTTVRKPSNYASPGSDCYTPRNALIFYDRNGRIFDYLEICFECMRDESQSHKVTIGTYCNQKYDLLKGLFIDVGIKYGTTRQ